MSQMVTRKGPVGDDKEKGQTDSPVKDMKKKVAANAEKEKQAAEKHAEKDKDKEKNEKHPEKGDKNAEKSAEKKEKGDKSSDRKEKKVEKETGEKGEKSEKPEKVSEKKTDAPAEKPKEDKNAKPDKPEDKEKDKRAKATPETPKVKQNGARANGLPAEANGDHSDATVSSDEEMVIDHERDDMFPELAYEDSDGEFEPPTPEGLPSRSYTRRSQAKATRTPETPRPASDKRADAADDSKESKVLKLKDDTPSTDRKLRSADSPKPESKKPEKTDKKETAKEDVAKTTEKSPKKKDLEVPEAKEDGNVDKSAVDIVIELDADEEAKSQEPRKADTNYSRSRVKVSPYRRAKADLTASSLLANYTGNNTTMEMDITETSSFVTEETPSMDSPYLLGLRSIRGRRSYKPLKEMTLRNISVNRSVHSTSTTSVSVTEQPSRPTAPVVGRKRRPEGEAAGVGGVGGVAEALELESRGKRARLLERLARPFRAVASTPLPARRNAEIVGINTDLPLTAPVASPDTFDPESLKLTSTPLPPAADAPLAPLTPVTPPEQERDPKAKCIVM